MICPAQAVLWRLAAPTGNPAPVTLPAHNPQDTATGEQRISRDRILAHDAAEFERLLMATLGREGQPATSDAPAPTARLVMLMHQAQLQGRYPHDFNDSLLELLGTGCIPLQDISLRDRNIIRFIDSVFRALFKDLPLDPVIVTLVQRLHIPLAQLALLDRSFLDNPDHSGRLLVDDICYHGIGWYDGIGKAGQRFMDTVCDALSKLDHEFEEDPARFAAIQQALHETLEKESLQFAKLVERTIATEKGLLNLRRAEQGAVDLINRITVGKALPPRVTALLQKQWYLALKQVLIHTDVNSEAWARMKKLTTNMVWTVLPSADEQERQKRMVIIPRLPEFIHGELQQYQLAGVDVDDIIRQLEWVHVQILKGEKLEMLPVTPMSTAAAEAGVDVEISAHLISHAKAIGVGQWFLFSQDNAPSRRIKLIQKDADSNHYLFVNRAGLKELGATIEQLAYYLVSGRLKALNHQRPFSNAFLRLTKQLLQQYEEFLDREAQEIERDRVRAETEARNRQVAAEKARREAEEFARRETEARERAEEEARRAEERRRSEELARERSELAAREKAYRAAIDAMTLGTWVQFFQDDGSMLECNLALKMRSTDKFVFVNRAGIKVAEKKGEELLALMNGGKFAIVDAGSMADSAIQRLIGTLKRD